MRADGTRTGEIESNGLSERGRAIVGGGSAQIEAGAGKEGEIATGDICIDGTA